MIDLHAHVLPGVDDGPKTLEDTLAVVRQATTDGTTIIVSVAHANDGHFDVSRAQYEKAFSAASTALAAASIGVKLIPAMEVRLGPRLAQDFAEGKFLAIGNTGYFCVELPPNDFPAYTLDALFELSLEKLRILLIHPERNRGLRKRPELADRLLRMEVLGVASGGSLLGQFGPEVEAAAWQLIEMGLIQAVASDGHSVSKRPLRLSAYEPVIARRYGEAVSEAMLHTTPQQVLEGLPVELAPHERIGWRRFFAGR
ncbi:MAG: hypothetical protein C7B46_03980 [Sulfobacillus benefaciens]|uniref:protein-tyrosine-phosphatase n=1 Tax=Sulfobacillus benefaciens TaxID=453960 RepID=A0A2T2XJC5_9FIRM|nr:MAG: hypothetical protein C7B46_03980 [Sulfobacillus benefaciens]